MRGDTGRTLRLWRETSARDTVCLPFLSRQFVMRSATSRSCVFFASLIFLRDLQGENTRTGTTVSAASGRWRASRRQTPRAASAHRRRPAWRMAMARRTHSFARASRSPCSFSRSSTVCITTRGCTRPPSGGSLALRAAIGWVEEVLQVGHTRRPSWREKDEKDVSHAPVRATTSMESVAGCAHSHEGVVFNDTIGGRAGP